MTKEYRTKVFKSGNSLAVRLPKGLGILPGAEFSLSKDDDGRIIVEPVTPIEVTLADLFGSFSAGFLPDGRLPADEPERDWNDSVGRRVA